MKEPFDERGHEALRRRAERALDEGRGRKAVEPLLRRLLDLAPEGHSSRIFAHRHLAELRLELDPWSAALHLRAVLAVHPTDDVAQSLMALAQALLGNYRVAVACYRRAIAQSPDNPWYHHNLGHLLDVALDAPEAALPHLEKAVAYAIPAEHEITASAAHCLGRLGRFVEAEELAREATAAAPDSAEHAALLEWVLQGAPADGPVSVGRPGAAPPAPTHSDTLDAVARLIERHMYEAGLSPVLVNRAQALWSDYRIERGPRIKKPEVCAAAVHYAITRVAGERDVTQAAIARRYGVAAKSVSSRYGDIRDALALRPGDPRYD